MCKYDKQFANTISPQVAFYVHLIRVSVQTIYPIATLVDTSEYRTFDKSYSFDSKEERARKAMKLN